jgi:hypothetical protein
LGSIGNERYEEYVKCYLTHEITVRKGEKRIKRTPVHNFDSKKTKKTRKEITTEKMHKASMTFLSKMMDWCRRNRIPPDDAQQFIKIPMAIAKPDGMPYQTQKSKIVAYFRKNFNDAFYEIVVPSSIQIDALVYDAMFLLKKRQPVPGKNRFGIFVESIFDKYVLDPFRQDGYKEIHLCFDEQGCDLETPKSIERERRDSTQAVGALYENITENTTTPLPQNWGTFLANRSNKKAFVAFLSHHFMKLALQKLPVGKKLIVSGGFEDSKIAKVAFSQLSSCGNIVTGSGPLVNYHNSHQEGDTAVWLHAVQCPAKTVLIYSPDTDIMNVGFGLLPKYPENQFIIELNRRNGNRQYLNLNLLAKLMSKNKDLKWLDFADMLHHMQVLFVTSGCDYLSFFKHHTKHSIYDAFLDNIDFMALSDLPGSLTDTRSEDCIYEQGLLAFYRLIGCVYLPGCAYMFTNKFDKPKKPSATDLYYKVKDENPGVADDVITCIWLEAIRNATRTCSAAEDYWIPSDDSLKLHWFRTCYIIQIWKQADVNYMHLESLENWGWCYNDEKQLLIKWDSNENFKKIDKYRKLWTEGCHCEIKHCKRGSACSCLREGKSCGPSCRGRWGNAGHFLIL